MKNGHYYRIKIKALYGDGYYETVLKYDGYHNCFNLGCGAIIKPDSKRIISIEEFLFKDE